MTICGLRLRCRVVRAARQRLCDYHFCHTRRASWAKTARPFFIYMNDDAFKTKLCALLAESMDAPDEVLLAHVTELLQLRAQVAANAALEQRIRDLIHICNCNRQTALDILAAQGKA